MIPPPVDHPAWPWRVEATYLAAIATPIALGLGIRWAALKYAAWIERGEVDW